MSHLLHTWGSMRVALVAALVAGTVSGTPPLAQGQALSRAPALSAFRPWAANVIIPQSRAFDVQRRGRVEIASVNVGVVIVEQVATTTMDIRLKNPTGRNLEAELMVPVPDRAVVRGFDFQGSGSQPSAQLLSRDEARRIYDSIVAKVKDPALLEFIGYNLIRSSVFPVPAGGEQKVRLTYETILSADGNRVDYVLPRSESLDYKVPWSVKVRIRSKQRIATVYSPSHNLETQPGPNPQTLSVKTSASAGNEPGSFRLSYLLEGEGLTASLMAYPTSSDDGYFLLLTGLPDRRRDDKDSPKIRREVTLVLDRSGSMNGPKLEQVRQAALQIIAGLKYGESFNIILYNEVVESFADRPVVKSKQTESEARAFLEAMRARGGTNIHDALLESLRPRPTPGTLPLVLFLTDGRPTIGQTAEAAIRALAEKSNPYERRIFTFGVGVDVNSPLLENLAYKSRATATFVLPQEDVEVKVAGVFKRLSGPILAKPKLEFLTSAGEPARGRISDLIPAGLPDLFRGDQLVLLGRYVGRKPIQFALSGNYLGQARTFKFQFNFKQATTKNAFVPRLWAGRKIGLLVDEIRSRGADPATAVNDPKLKELVDEIVRLSMEFGILSEYTAFLARQGTDLTQKDRVLAEAGGDFLRRAIQSRTGAASVNQDLNSIFQKGQSWENRRNAYYDDKLNRVEITQVRQVADRCFYHKSNMWVEGRLVDQKIDQPARRIEFGSPQFMQLARRLADEGRQGLLALNRDTLLLIDGEPTLVVSPPATQN